MIVPLQILSVFYPTRSSENADGNNAFFKHVLPVVPVTVRVDIFAFLIRVECIKKNSQSTQHPLQKGRICRTGPPHFYSVDIFNSAIKTTS